MVESVHQQPVLIHSAGAVFGYIYISVKLTNTWAPCSHKLSLASGYCLSSFIDFTVTVLTIFIKAKYCKSQPILLLWCTFQFYFGFKYIPWEEAGSVVVLSCRYAPFIFIELTATEHFSSMMPWGADEQNQLLTRVLQISPMLAAWWKQVVPVSIHSPGAVCAFGFQSMYFHRFFSRSASFPSCI